MGSSVRRDPWSWDPTLGHRGHHLAAAETPPNSDSRRESASVVARARNHLPANRSLEFRFDILA